MKGLQIPEMSSRATSWVAEQAHRVAVKNRRNRLAVLYFILSDLVLLLFMGIVDTGGGIEAWLFLNGLVLVVFLFVRAIIMLTEDGF